MNENCRLCLNIVNRKRTTIMQSEFRRMMRAVFSFPIVNKEGLSIYVCTGCSSAVRNFFSYTLKVQQNQQWLEQQYHSSHKTISSNCNTRAMRSRGAINDSFEHHSADEIGGKGLRTVDTHIQSACQIQLVQADPLSGISTIEHNSSDLKVRSIRAGRSLANQIQRGEITSIATKQQHSDLRYSCDECELKLSNKTQLYKHRRVHQKKECPVCNLLFRSDKIKEHFSKKHPDDKLLHGSGEYRCANCQELFETEAQLNNHLVPNQISSNSIALHSENQLPMSNTEFDEFGLLPGTDNFEVNEKERVYYCTKRYKCCKCEEKFFDKIQVVKHQRLHRTAECPMCNKVLRTDRIKQHIATRHPKDDGSSNDLFKCTECKKLFANASLLAIHRRTHKKQVCPVCNESASSSHIQKHLQSSNGIEQSDDSHEVSGGLADINSVSHSKNQSIQCDACRRTFLTKFQLQKHQRVHRNKECPVCRKLLPSHTILTHLTAKHPETADKYCEGNITST